MLGADGIHSDTCETYADELGARTIDGSARFSWFGTNADFDAANTPSTAGNART